MDSRAALRITSIYVALAGVWILASDSIVARVFPDAASRYQFSVLKGLAFVTLTGAVLFLLVRAQVQKLEGQRNRAEASNAELRQRDAELRHSLAERQRLYDELEARTRHSASLEAQLRQAQKMEGIGRLAGGVAHDFNNMLTIILSAAELLPEELPPKHPAHALVDEIKDAAGRCAALTRQLLIFSRKHATQLELLDLNVQVADARKLLLRVIGEDITFTANLQAIPAPVRLDPVHLQQLLVNLAVNARDAMPSGGRLVIQTETREVTAEEVEAFPGVKPGPFVVLGLTDTGCGMSAETIEHIFEPFFTTKPEGKGTGLGLATVYEIVSQAGGFVRVDSVVDQGTTFRVYLPLAAGELQPSAAAIPTASRVGSECVLLVEDEDALRAMMRHALRRQGYTVLEARNAGEALLLSEQSSTPIHLLLTDVVMPIMRGTQLAARLRELKPELKVLLISGYADDLTDGLERRQADGLLQKPFTADALTARVRKILDGPLPTPA